MNIRTRKSFLIEATLSKGSQKVINDSNLVAGLADAMRDDARSNPSSFPAGSAKTFQKAPDEDLANWFLENIDKIEREGYEGTVYSRDGLNNDWIVRRYIAGSHNWEDLTGVMNMNLRDWYLLKNRNLLDANHKDLPKFKSVRDVGYYMTTHYKKALDDARDAAKNAARNKMAKSVKLVDNEDYRIYTTLNRAAGCALGLGTQWCTANSNYPGHYHTYSNRAMLFQMFPYKKVKDAEGKSTAETTEDGKKVINDTTKYQFDAGGPNFMDITDRPVAPAFIAETYPYLYTDLSTALKQNKEKMEQAFKELAGDPTLQADDFKIKTYEIDDEIEKLHKFVERGYFTDKVRSKAKANQEKNAETPEIPKQVTQSPPQGEPQMEKVDKDVAAMLKSLKKYDQLVESVAPVLGMKTLTGKKVSEGEMFHPEHDRMHGAGPDRDPNIMRDEYADAKESVIDLIHNEVIKLLKEYESKLAEVGVYGDPDSRKIAELLYDYDTDGVFEELHYLDQDGGLSYRAEPYIEDLMSDLEYIADEIKGNRMYEDDSMEENVFRNPNLPADKQLPDPPKEIDMNIDEGDMEEGNEFSGKLADAKRDHKKNFTVGDKTYPVREEMSPQSSYASVGPAGYAALMKMSEMPGLEIDPDEDTKMATVTVLSKLYPGSVKALQGLMQQKLIKPIAGFAHREIGARPATGSVNEQADPDVLAWMNRFAKLGNMKGYGR